MANYSFKTCSGREKRSEKQYNKVLAFQREKKVKEVNKCKAQ